MRLLDRDGLAEKGIKHSSTQIWRLVKARKFPAPVKVGGKNAWVEKAWYQTGPEPAFHFMASDHCEDAGEKASYFCSRR